MPVQWVNRPNLDFRGFSGTVVGGTVNAGDAVAVAASGRTSTVARIVTMDGDLAAAAAGEAVTLTLADEVDMSRGDLLCAASARPEVSDQFAAHLIWMSEEQLYPGRQYIMKLATSSVTAQVTALKHKVDVDNLDHLAAKTLHLNEIGYVNVSLATPVAFDRYQRQPRHRRLHPDRPLHQRDGRRRHDRLRAPARDQCALAGASTSTSTRARA